MIFRYLRERVALPPHLCFPGRTDFIETDEPVVVVDEYKDGTCEVLTLGGVIYLRNDQLVPEKGRSK